MKQFIPGNAPLVFPAGTKVAHNSATWAMYTNLGMNTTWIGYVVPGGTQIMRLPGIKSRGNPDFAGIQSFVEQRQAMACGECGE